MKKWITLSLTTFTAAALATNPGPASNAGPATFQPGIPFQNLFPVQDPFGGLDFEQFMQNGDMQELMQQMQKQFGQLGQLGQQFQQDWQQPFRPQGPMTYLGVKLGPVSEALAHHMNLPKGFYQTVKSVEAGSPAEKAGLQEFDIITHLDDQEIINEQQLVTLIRDKKEGDEVSIKILRKGKEKELTAKLVQIEGGDALPPWNDPHMDMNELFKNLQKNLGQLRQAPPRMQPPRAPNRPGKPKIELIPKDGPRVEKHFESSRSMSVQNDKGHFQFNEQNGNKHLTIKDPEGNLLFDGPVNTDEERKSVPKEFQATLKQLEGDGKGRFQFKQQFKLPQQPKKPGLQKKPQAL